MEIIARLANLPGALPGACAQGLIWGIMAIGVYLTYRILDVADLTVDGSFGTGGAVCVMCLLSGMNVWLALLVAVLAGLAAGCDNLRVGLEDNVFMKKGEYATNAQLVERAVKLGILAGREIATAAEAREILGIKPEKGVLYQP